MQEEGQWGKEPPAGAELPQPSPYPPPGGYGAYGGVDDDDDEQSIGTTSTPVKALHEYWVHDIKREFTYRSCPFFMLTLVLTTLSAGLALPIPAENRVGFFVQEAVTQDLLLGPQFREVRSPAGFYVWLREVARSMWVPRAQIVRQDQLPTHQLRSGLPAERSNIPLYFMTIQQHRVLPESCEGDDQAVPILRTLWDRVRPACFPNYDRDILSNREFRPSNAVPPNVSLDIDWTDPYIADDFKTEPRPLVPPWPKLARAQLRSYAGTGRQFTATLPYQNYSLEDTLAVISYLSEYDWIDYSTRVVKVETIFFNPEAGVHTHGTYTLARWMLEFDYSGMPATLTWTRPFRLLRIDRWPDGLCFAFDIILLLYVPWLIKDIAWLVHTNYRLSGEVTPVTTFGVVEFLHLLHMILLLTALIYRLIIWNKGDNIEANLEGKHFYDKIVRYQEDYETARHVYVALVFVAWLRVLEYSRFNSRLNAVTETVRLAAGDLFSLFILWAVVLLTFALVGNGLWGNHVADLSSLGRAADWLITTVFTADVQGTLDTYDKMKDTEPVWTPAFVLLFFFFWWLIILNVVLGILATGFSLASASTTDRSWEWTSVRNSLADMAQNRQSVGVIGYFCPFGSRFYEDRIDAAQYLTAKLEEEERVYNTHNLSLPVEQRKPFDAGKSRLTKHETLRLTRDPDWSLTKEETARGFDECVEWWRGNLSDIASQQQTEREQLRCAISDISQKMKIFQVSVDQRLSSLERKSDLYGQQVVRDVQMCHRRHESHQSSLDDVRRALGAGVQVRSPPRGYDEPAPAPGAPPLPQHSHSPAFPPVNLYDLGQPGEALYRDDWLPCAMIQQRDDASWLVAWGDGTWTDGVRPEHVRTRVVN